MTAAAEAYVFHTFLVFCRVGLAFAAMPAMGGTRYPPLVRVLFALAAALALAPLVTPAKGLNALGGADTLLAILFEVLTGFLLGFWSSCFVHALRFAGTFIVNAIGLAGIPGQPVDEAEPSSHIATLLTLGLTLLIFATNLHLQSVEALVESYHLVPMGAPLAANLPVRTSAEILSRTFYLGLQFSSPFLIFSIVWNFALGLANRMTPQLSVYFAFSGLLTLVSLGVLALVAPKLLYIPLSAYGDFLASGFQ